MNYKNVDIPITSSSYVQKDTRLFKCRKCNGLIDLTTKIMASSVHQHIRYGVNKTAAMSRTTLHCLDAKNSVKSMSMKTNTIL